VLTKICRVSESLGATIYPINTNADQHADSLHEVTVHIEDLELALSTLAAPTMHNLLQWVRACSAGKTSYTRRRLYMRHSICSTMTLGVRCSLWKGGAPHDIEMIQLALRHAIVSKYFWFWLFFGSLILLEEGIWHICTANPT
jgi:V-type H+-transporting ATPase subunit a